MMTWKKKVGFWKNQASFFFSVGLMWRDVDFEVTEDETIQLGFNPKLGCYMFGM